MFPAPEAMDWGCLMPGVPLRFTRGYNDSAPMELLMHDFGFIQHPTSDIQHQPLSVLRQ
jgi:hypothetical protein